MQVYLAHTYGGDRGNIEKAGALAARLKAAHPDWNLFSPLHNFAWETYDAAHYAKQLAECLLWLNGCTAVYFARGWEYSTGCLMEMAWAMKTGKRIYLEGREEKEMDRREDAITSGMENLKMLMQEVQKHRDLMRNEWENGNEVRKCHMHARVIDRLLELAEAQNDEIRDLFDDIIDGEEADEEE